MASIKISFRPSEDITEFIQAADKEDLEVLKQEIQNVSEGKPLSYCISYINQMCRNLWLETSLYAHLHSILKAGIESWILNQGFYADMSVGYTQLMNQIGVIQLLFQYFEKYVMKDEDIKTIRLLQISILKEKLTQDDIANMVQSLLDNIDSMRKGNKVNIESTHNLTLLLIDIDEYKKSFEPRLKSETAKYYSNLCKIRCEDELKIVEYLDFVKQSLEIESKICNEILVPISHYLQVDAIYNQCIKAHYKYILNKGFLELIKEKKYSHIQLLYEFIWNVNLLSEMYIAFNNSVYETGSKIVSTYLSDSNDEYINAIESTHTGQDLKERIKMFIPKLLEYREDIKEVLSTIMKASDNNEHSYAFK